MKTLAARRLCAFAVLAVPQFTFAPHAYAVAENWQVGRMAGRAWIDGADGERANIALGMNLEPGVTIYTADRSSVTLLRGTETMTIGPKSIVAVSEHPTEGLSTTVLERAGSVEFDVERQNVKHFSVETPMLAAVVKGTHFKVSVGRRNGGVSVARGTVEVTSLATGQVADVTKGQRVNVGGHGGMSFGGSGRHPSITQGQPRPAMMAPVGAFPTAAVPAFTAAEMSAVATVSAPTRTAAQAGYAAGDHATGPSNSASRNVTSAAPTASFSATLSAAVSTVAAAFSGGGQSPGGNATSVSSPASAQGPSGAGSSKPGIGGPVGGPAGGPGHGPGEGHGRGERGGPGHGDHGGPGASGHGGGQGPGGHPGGPGPGNGNSDHGGGQGPGKGNSDHGGGQGPGQGNSDHGGGQGPGNGNSDHGGGAGPGPGNSDHGGGQGPGSNHSDNGGGNRGTRGNGNGHND